MWPRDRIADRISRPAAATPMSFSLEEPLRLLNVDRELAKVGSVAASGWLKMTFHRIDTFATKRLTAERLCKDHLADLVALHLDPDVSRYLGGVRAPERTAAYLTVNVAHWDHHGFGLWVLRTRAGQFVGRAGIRHIAINGMDEIEVAYALGPLFWGQGLASEITRALADVGLIQLAIPSLIGVVSIENIASRRVLEKSSFTFEGRSCYHDEDVVVYRRMRSERS
jgi:RimJ/RimL family protein N-acetyltransferase